MITLLIYNINGTSGYELRFSVYFRLSLECGCFIHVANPGSVPFHTFVFLHPPPLQGIVYYSLSLSSPHSLPSLFLNDRMSQCIKIHQNYPMRQINISKRIVGLFHICSILKILKIWDTWIFVEINELCL